MEMCPTGAKVQFHTGQCSRGLVRDWRDYVYTCIHIYIHTSIYYTHFLYYCLCICVRMYEDVCTQIIYIDNFKTVQKSRPHLGYGNLRKFNAEELGYRFMEKFQTEISIRRADFEIKASFPNTMTSSVQFCKRLRE